MRTKDLWDEQDPFLPRHVAVSRRQQRPTASTVDVGVIPLFATKVLREEDVPTRDLRKGSRAMAERRGIDEHDVREARVLVGEPGDRRLVVGVAARGRVRRILSHLFAEDSFLSPYGLRALSRWHMDHPFQSYCQ